MRSRLRHATNEAILDAAEQVFAQDGLAAANMTTIARRAGVAVGTLYNHFRDRDALVKALFQARRTEFSARLDRVIAENATAPFSKQLRSYVRTVLEMCDARRAFVRISLEGEYLRWRGHAPPGRPAMQHMAERLEPLMFRGVKEGVLREEGAELHAACLAGILKAVMFRLVEQERPLVAAADDIVNAFLFGVAGRDPATTAGRSRTGRDKAR